MAMPMLIIVTYINNVKALSDSEPIKNGTAYAPTIPKIAMTCRLYCKAATTVHTVKKTINIKAKRLGKS